MTQEELDKLPYGTILLNMDGIVTGYNKQEEEITGFKKENVLGKHFFTEVAPCTAVQNLREI